MNLQGHRILYGTMIGEETEKDPLSFVLTLVYGNKVNYKQTSLESSYRYQAPEK